jgi:hypothetical protein
MEIMTIAQPWSNRIDNRDKGGTFQQLLALEESDPFEALDDASAVPTTAGLLVFSHLAR